MKFFSVNGKSPLVFFREALMNGTAPDGGLYVPEYLPALSSLFLNNLENENYQSISEQVISKFIDEIPPDDLKIIISDSLNFQIPLVKLYDKIFLLELFHGPTLAFKDVGARFMAVVLSYFLQREQKEITILVATSGDTGSAVAQGFYNVPNINVFILYPSGKVSRLQEQQMTTLGGNIQAIEVDGTFDDCQRLVKQSLSDSEIKKKHALTTANSINLGRLIPQITYYFWGLTQLKRDGVFEQPNIVVPCGNFGNITAAIYAKKMGAPINQFVASTNTNNVFLKYLDTGKFTPQPSLQTYSNAMDVGDPSNLARIRNLYNDDIKRLQTDLCAVSISDDETILEIRRTYEKTNYILDPHTAVGISAATKLSKGKSNYPPVIVTATAHPAKFSDVIKKSIAADIQLPQTLQDARLKKKQCINISRDYGELKNILLKM